MKKIFTLIALLGMFCSGAWAQIVGWSMSNTSYSGGQELSNNTSVVSVKLGSGTWSYNATWGVEAAPDNAAPTMVDNIPTSGNYIIISPAVDIDFSLDVRASTNHNFKVVEASAPTTNVFYLRGRYYLTYAIGTLKAGKTYYAYSEGGASLGYRAFTAKTIETLTIHYQDAEGNELKSDVQRTDVYGTVTTATDAETAPIDVNGDIYVYSSGNADVTLGTTNTITLVYEKTAAEPTNYVINYQLSDGTVIADPVNHSGLVGDEASADAGEVPTYIVKDGIKYKYASGDSPITLEADENQNVINLIYAEAAKYVGTILAVDNGGEQIAEIGSIPAVYEGDSYTYAYPQYVLNGTTLYNVPNIATGDYYRKTVTPVANNYFVFVTYNGPSVNDVVYYTEGENIPAITVVDYTNRASNGRIGHTGTSSNYKDVTTILPGKYRIYLRGLNGNKDTRTANFKIGEDVVYTFGITQGTNQLGNSEEITVYETSTLAFACDGSSASGCDWFYIVKTGDAPTSLAVTVPAEVGYTTYNTPCALDFTGITGLTAYVATAANNETVTIEEVTGAVPANTGLLIKGDGNYEVPVAASATAPAVNYFVGCATATTVEATAEGTNLVLAYDPNHVDETLGFYTIGATSAPVAAGKAYLHVPAAAPAKLRIAVKGETTGITNINAAQKNNVTYNLAGQRVNAQAKGIVVLNGKKLVK